jgi:hypothetical protein
MLAAAASALPGETTLAEMRDGEGGSVVFEAHTTQPDDAASPSAHDRARAT